MMARPRVLFAWEMGDNFGHVSKVAEAAQALAGRAEITVAVRNPIAFRQIAPDLDVQLLQAPTAPPYVPRTREEAGHSLSDVLRHGGWSSPQELGALTEAWRALFALVQPDVLASQAAPTSLLSARGLAIRTVVFGSGFDTPPRAHPMPPFLHWEDGSADLPSRREKDVLGTANQVLARMDAPTLDQFCDLLRTDRYLLATFPEIDHYAPRSSFEADPPRYLGQLVSTSSGKPMSWRKGATRRILAYLRPGQTGFDPAAEALSRLDRRHDVILAAPGIPKALATKLSKGVVRVVDGPVRLDRLLVDCDLGISHASNGIVAAFIQAGVPQVGLPTHPEQIMVARAAALSRLGLALIGQYGPEHVTDIIAKTLAGAHLRETAQKVGKRLRTEFPDGPGQSIADEIMSLV